MENQTINGISSNGRFVVNDSNNLISITCDTNNNCFILTTSPTPAARASMLHIQGLGEYYCYAGSYTTRSDMRSYLIMLTLNGSEVLDYQNNHYEIPENSFYWIDCMYKHHFHTLPKNQPRHALWIHFHGPNAEFYYQQFLRLNNNSHVCHLPEDGLILGHIQQLILLYNNRSESLDLDIAASSLVTSILVACIQATSAQITNSPIPKYIQVAKSYIDQNYRKYIVLDTLSELVSINKYHLLKQFKRHIGLSPYEYLTHVRMTHAKALLRSTDNPISSIAEEIGLYPVSNFSRMFKNLENMSPSQYRQRWIDPQLVLLETPPSNSESTPYQG